MCIARCDFVGEVIKHVSPCGPLRNQRAEKAASDYPDIFDKIQRYSFDAITLVSGVAVGIFGALALTGLLSRVPTGALNHMHTWIPIGASAVPLVLIAVRFLWTGYKPRKEMGENASGDPIKYKICNFHDQLSGLIGLVALGTIAVTLAHHFKGFNRFGDNCSQLISRMIVPFGSAGFFGLAAMALMIGDSQHFKTESKKQL